MSKWKLVGVPMRKGIQAKQLVKGRTEIETPAVWLCNLFTGQGLAHPLSASKMRCLKFIRLCSIGSGRLELPWPLQDLKIESGS